MWRLSAFACVALLACVAGEGYAAAGVAGPRIAEADRLIEACDAAVAALEVGHAARDDVRAVKGKLVSLREAAPLTEPAEWDAMLRALLSADYYGTDDLIGLLNSHRKPAGAEEACDEPATAEPARRLGERTEPASETAKAAAAREFDRRKRRAVELREQLEREQVEREMESFELEGAEEEYELEAPAEWAEEAPAADAAPADAMRAERSLLSRLRAWLLDRPPPWERDCDCCFPQCPPGHHCLGQSDGLYLACRGRSVGELLASTWSERPLATVAALLALCLLGYAFGRQQLNAFREARRPRGGKGAASGADDSDDSDDGEEESEEASGETSGEAGQPADESASNVEDESSSGEDLADSPMP